MTRVSRLSGLFKALLAVVLVWGLSPVGLLASAEKAYAASVDALSGYGAGDSVVLTVSAQTDNNPWYGQFELSLVYANGETHGIQVSGAPNQGAMSAQLDWGATVGSVTTTGDGNPNYTATITLPASLFTSSDFTISAGGTTLSSSDLGFSAEPAQQEDRPSDAGESGEGVSTGQPESSDAGQGGGSIGSGVEIGTLAPTASGSISVDGVADDWAGVSALASNDSRITEWKVARDTDGNVYFVLIGPASTQWDFQYEWINVVITQDGAAASIPCTWLASQTGATTAAVNGANHNTAGTNVFEALIPASYFTDANATIEFVGSSVSVSDLPVLDGNAAAGEDPVYNGIVIDGLYKDWAAVQRHPSNDPNGELDNVALVFDGDWVYVYVKEVAGGVAAHAGSHSNGQFEILTDLGERMLFELNDDGTVSGQADIAAQHVGAEWEIAIPASSLPPYLETISFGLYQHEPMISGVSNLNGQGSGGTFAGIVYDGLYGDWEYYPHHIIQYATAGTQEHVEDASGALYSEDGVLYGHVRSNMQDHLDNYDGHEFTTGVTIRFNDDESLDFYPMLVAVDANGNIDWNPQVRDLPNGTYEFHIASIDAWHTSANVSDLNEHDTLYGKMFVTVSDDIDQCEFYLDLGLVAQKLGQDPNDFRVISAQFINIGTEWISTAGTSTAPFVGVGLGIAVAACTLGYRRYSAKHDQDAAPASPGAVS